MAVWCIEFSISKVQEKVFQQVSVLSVWWGEPAPEFWEEINQQDASQQIKGFLINKIF